MEAMLSLINPIVKCFLRLTSTQSMAWSASRESMHSAKPSVVAFKSLLVKMVLHNTLHRGVEWLHRTYISNVTQILWRLLHLLRACIYHAEVRHNHRYIQHRLRLRLKYLQGPPYKVTTRTICMYKTRVGLITIASNIFCRLIFITCLIQLPIRSNNLSLLECFPIKHVSMNKILK